MKEMNETWERKVKIIVENLLRKINYVKWVIKYLTEFVSYTFIFVKFFSNNFL